MNMKFIFAIIFIVITFYTYKNITYSNYQTVLSKDVTQKCHQISNNLITFTINSTNVKMCDNDTSHHCLIYNNIDDEYLYCNNENICNKINACNNDPIHQYIDYIMSNNNKCIYINYMDNNFMNICTIIDKDLGLLTYIESTNLNNETCIDIKYNYNKNSYKIFNQFIPIVPKRNNFLYKCDVIAKSVNKFFSYYPISNDIVYNPENHKANYNYPINFCCCIKNCTTSEECSVGDCSFNNL